MDGSSTPSTHRRPPTSRTGLALALGLALGGCATPPAAPPAVMLPAPAAQPAPIPSLPATLPLVPPPPAAEAGKRYRVVVNHVPLRDVLFALARDAALNLDLRGELAEPVTLHVVDETVPQILERLSRQFELRYTLDGDRLTVAVDEPYFQTYDVGYVNLARDTETSVSVATQVATTGEGGAERASGGGGQGTNSSSTRVNSRASHRFWPTLAANILALLGASAESAASADELPHSDALIVNPEAGLVSVKATHRQHAEIAAFIEQVLSNARRQVLIEATVVEVSLNDRYQSGVDWQLILDEARAGLGASQNLIGALSDGAAALTLGYHHPDADGRVIDATLKLLHEFGDTQVLSSPRLMVLNNQTALLKVVEELVYFTVQVTATDGTANAQGRTVVQSEVHSVPVGLVMAVTPQISADAEVTLTVRPTISQKIGEAVDPGPQLALSLNGDGQSLPNNTVPVIRTREMESVLKLVNGQVGVLGGLMQDERTVERREVPGFSQLPGLGAWLFRGESRRHRKTELVIFLRPAVVETPSVARDLRDYQPWLERGKRS